MASSIMSALNEIKSKVDSGDLTLQSDGSSAFPQAGTVATATRMPATDDTMKGKKFVYLEGSQRGMQEEVDYTIEMNGKYSVIFKSGIQMLIESLVLQMAEVEDYKKAVKKVDGLRFEDDQDIDSIRPSRGKVPISKTAGLEEVAPVFDNDGPLPDGFERIGEGSQPVRRQAQQEAIPENPILGLLGKMKKTPKSIKLELKLNFPSKEMYKMLTDNFDGAEEAIIDFLTTGKNLKEFKIEMKNFGILSAQMMIELKMILSSI